MIDTRSIVMVNDMHYVLITAGHIYTELVKNLSSFSISALLLHFSPISIVKFYI